MSTLTRTDFAVANWFTRLVNEVRFMLGAKTGKHRSRGISTFEWVRMKQVARDC
jgi:hypothetical protein